MKKYELSLEIEGLPKMLNQILWTHWTVKKKHTDLWKAKVMQAIGAQKPTTPLKKAQVEFTRCSSKECDFDGLVGSFKPVADALTTCGIIEDDKVSVIGQPKYLWEKAKRSEGKIRVRVLEV